MNRPLKLAVPNKGRLSERALELLSRAGFHVPRHARRLMADVNDQWRLLFVRTDDIPEYVATGTADVGITGFDIVSEWDLDVEKVLDLGFGKCRLVVAVPESKNITDVQSLKGSRIATVFPSLTRKFFAKRNVEVDIIPLSGATEIAPSIGVADAIIDLVETGSTLRQNGLVVLETFLQSEAVMIANPNSMKKNGDALLELQTAIKSVLDANAKRYFMINAPKDELEQITALLPGVTAPTVMPLMGREGWVAVHAVIHEDDVNSIIPELRKCKAEGLLILPIERMMS